MLKKIMKVALAASLVFSFSAPVIADDDASIYGSVRMNFWQTTKSKEMSSAFTGAAVNPEAKADTDMALGMQGNSRLGIIKKKGDITGKLETGIYTGVGLRIFEASMPMGGGTLTMGQGYMPSIFMLNSNMVYGSDGDQVGLGAWYSGRLPRIAFKTGGFQIALTPTNAQTATLNDGTNTLGGGASMDVDTSLPKFEAMFGTMVGPAWIGAFYGMNSVKTSTIATTSVSYTISSSVVGLGVKAGAGPAKIGFNYYTATNSGSYGGYPSFLIGGTAPNNLPYFDSNSGANGKVVANTETGMLLRVDVPISETMAFGFGYTTKENKLGSITGLTGTSALTADDVSSMYLNLPIKVAAGFTVTPEYTSIDHKTSFNPSVAGSTANKQGTITAFGAKLQMDF